MQVNTNKTRTNKDIKALSYIILKKISCFSKITRGNSQQITNVSLQSLTLNLQGGKNKHKEKNRGWHINDFIMIVR